MRGFENVSESCCNPIEEASELASSQLVLDPNTHRTLSINLRVKHTRRLVVSFTRLHLTFLTSFIGREK